MVKLLNSHLALFTTFQRVWSVSGFVRLTRTLLCFLLVHDTIWCFILAFNPLLKVNERVCNRWYVCDGWLVNVCQPPDPGLMAEQTNSSDYYLLWVRQYKSIKLLTENIHTKQPDTLGGQLTQVNFSGWTALYGDVKFGSQIGSFCDQISLQFDSPCQNVLKSDLKKSQICPI